VTYGALLIFRPTFFLGIALVACRSPAPPPPAQPERVVEVREVDASRVELPPPDPGCNIALGAVLAANVWRGVRDTPSRRASYEHLDPKTRAEWDAHDHGLLYLLCKYAVRMNGRAYTYEHVAGQNVTRSAPLDVAECATDERRAAVAKEIRESTKECTDPHHGAYWGYDLVPAD
jgi:hypothetical protein